MECVSYNKDFLVDKVIKETKFKDDRGIKGKVLVEIFDAKTNKKVKEAYTENIIPDLFFKDMFLRHFAGGIMGINTRSQDQFNNNFECIYLTDSTKPESANTEKVTGNIIGYAYRNTEYSGTDTLRGTINKLESKMEIVNGKIRTTFVFDFPTHAANGRFESIYWGAEPSKREKFFIGPPIFGRNNGDGTVYAKQNLYKEKYWSIINIFYSGGSSGYFRKALRFNDYNKGYALLDGTNTSATNSSYIQFPESLKGHQLYVPIDLSLDYYVDFTNAVKLLNSSGGAFNSNELHDVVPVYKENGEIDYFVGVYIYYSSPNYYLKIYKWSNVGVLLSTVGPINLTTNFKDAYNSNFNYITYTINPLMSGEGYIEIYGYNSRTDTQYNETVYTNRLLRLDINGNLTSELNLKPKIGSSTWFASKGMNSGNIERRCYLSNLNYRTKNRIYLYYSGTQGGTGFYQVITPEGNLVEAYREYFTFEDYSDSTAYPIIGTDKSVSMYRYSYNDYVYFGIYHLSLSKPCGAHTKLAQPVEKTDANTMKIQYTFEIDLIDFAFDYY